MGPHYLCKLFCKFLQREGYAAIVKDRNNRLCSYNMWNWKRWNKIQEKSLLYKIKLLTRYKILLSIFDLKKKRFCRMKFV